jgi:hypothetical protein
MRGVGRLPIPKPAIDPTGNLRRFHPAIAATTAMMMLKIKVLRLALPLDSALSTKASSSGKAGSACLP